MTKVKSAKYKQTSLDSDEAAHDEPPHLDLLCLQMQLKIFISGGGWGVALRLNSVRAVPEVNIGWDWRQCFSAQSTIYIFQSVP